ncbi:FMN-dependent NADH-azoreductase [Devosia rhizoryzae]|uniref:FMN dependent NADH:quinone oxidoreductase n=1 Tax=Devosia rhizoryzae TaxID=2774137 RepID=A0ABX7CAE0_9HYPH|nr:NAD(P)H-dependent oxidoreductase [Devosia rhizoryzae]QQR39565.1 NAD(P)H-dependent oxidoreductase [Devosia rhizoryzae]
MSTLFRLDASIRHDGSVTRSVADRLQAGVEDNADARIVRRDVGIEPLPATAWAAAVFGPYTPAEQRSAEQNEGLALSKQVADELASADAFIFAIPLYNYGVSQHFKAWIDLLLTDARFAPGTQSPIKGRPAQLVVAKGGGYGPGTPRHGWDHATAYYRRVLEDMLGLEVEVMEVELTLAEVTPAMEALRPQAAQILADAYATAEKRGKLMAERLSVPAAA